MKKTRIHVCVFFLTAGLMLFILLCSKSQGAHQAIFQIHPQTDRTGLTPFLSVYRDDPGTLEIEDFLDPKKNIRFKPVNGKSSFGYSTAHFWFKFTANNSSKETIAWVMEYPYGVVDHFEFFHPGIGGYTRFVGGDIHPFSLRPVDYRTIAIPILMPPGEHTFYFTIHSRGTIVSTVIAWEKTAFDHHRTVDFALNLIYCGIMLATFIYCLMIYFSMGQSVFLFLAFFVAGTTLLTMVHTGLAFQYLWPESTKWANLCHPLSGIIGVSGAILFTRSFLETKRYLPRFDNLFKAQIYVFLLLFFASFFLPYSISTRAMLLLSGFVALTMMASGILLFLKQIRRAKFFLVAWSPLLLGTTLMLIKSFGFIGNNLFTDSTLQVSSALVAILLSFALMDNINTMIREREIFLNHIDRSERMYRMLAENVKDVIWLLDLATMKLVYVTPSIKEMMGYTPKEAENFKFKDMLPGESGKNAWKAIKQGMKKSTLLPGKTRHAFTIELECYNRERDIFWTETTTTFIRDKQGKPVEMIGVSRNITERKNAEKEKQALEHQLNQSRKMEAIGTLAGGIAHDMNNIVGGILGYAELSMNEADRETRMYHRLSRIVKACYRARDMVRQILAFSRRDNMVFETIAITPIAGEVVKLIQVSLPPDIIINQEISDKSLMIRANPTQVHQVIMNLCTNAGQAMEEKGGVLRISIQRKIIDKKTDRQQLHLLPGSYIKLTVSDTGYGMSEKTMARIFEPFFTTKSFGNGTGMGLSMVHGIMEKLGGRVYVQSTPGKGACFDLFFPEADLKAPSPGPINTLCQFSPRNSSE